MMLHWMPDSSSNRLHLPNALPFQWRGVRNVFTALFSYDSVYASTSLFKVLLGRMICSRSSGLEQ